MNRTLLTLWLSVIVVSACQAQSWTDDYSKLLAKYVTPKGVKYAAWKANADDMAAIAKVSDAVAKASVPSGREDKIAFYINAYDANILAQVLDKYPTKSVRDLAPLFGFFTRTSLTVAGEKMSFNHLEKDVIRPLKEPRIHFALNCASASCPPLRNKPFTGAKLDSELDAMTTPFLNSNPKGLEVSKDAKEASVSKIFDWDKEDFLPAGGTVGFINKYHKPALPTDVKVSFQDYDWSINATE